MFTKEDLTHIFTYHQPGPEDVPKYEAIREAGLAFAACIVGYTPASADQTVAVRKIREAVMTANAAIALDKGLAPDPKPETESPKHGAYDAKPE